MLFSEQFDVVEEPLSIFFPPPLVLSDLLSRDYDGNLLSPSLFIRRYPARSRIPRGLIHDGEVCQVSDKFCPLFGGWMLLSCCLLLPLRLVWLSCRNSDEASSASCRAINAGFFSSSGTIDLPRYQPLRHWHSQQKEILFPFSCSRARSRVLFLRSLSPGFNASHRDPSFRAFGLCRQE